MLRTNSFRVLSGPLVVLIFTLLLAGCGPIPRPFGRDASSKLPNDFLIVREAAGIYVKPVEGPVPWVGEAMAQAMARVLVDHQVVASADAKNRNSFILSSQGYQQLHRGRPADLIMEWVLTDSDGKVIGERTSTTVPPADFWTSPKPEHFKDIAEHTAPAIAAWLLPELKSAIHVSNVPLFVDLIDGASGRGNAVLRQTMLRRLKGLGVPLVDATEITDDALTLKCSIEIKPLDGKRDRVSISWKLLDPKKKQIGVIDQSNAVPANTIEDSWLTVAPMVVDGALDGLVPLLRAYERQRLGGKAVTKRQ